MNYFISAIGTDSGKTIISAIVTEALQADYWKPVQAGLEVKDSDTVKHLLTNTTSNIHPEQWLLKSPMSPHLAAEKDNINIELDSLSIPATNNKNLVIEGAGGLLVPINGKQTVLDLFQKLEGELVLISNIYLGSINHTLLSVNELKNRGVKVKGIIFNGNDPDNTKKIILEHSGYKELLHVPTLETISSQTIQSLAKELIKNW